MEACQISDQHVNEIFENEFPQTVKFLGLINLGITLETKQSKHGLTEVLKDKKCKIETLSLTNNLISIKGALAISQGLCLNKSIKILEMQGNMLGPKGCYLLCEALKDSYSRITSLDLSYNDIRCTGAHSLSLALNSTQIKELRLQGNNIASEGLISLFKSLKTSRVKILDLS